MGGVSQASQLADFFDLTRGGNTHSIRTLRSVSELARELIVQSAYEAYELARWFERQG
jgi:hypothetical protein